MLMCYNNSLDKFLLMLKFHPYPQGKDLRNPNHLYQSLISSLKFFVNFKAHNGLYLLILSLICQMYHSLCS